ncbi:heat shock factor protein 5 [Hoplias malabaricus]|uniref:heat shock factor protein 5 n=1 Tax=Hoplias malabaricus TaxID=27720 RepID=UPI003461BB7B
MEIDEALLAIPINPNNFPAKLWYLVNNPQIRSINWNFSGEAVVIDQQVFEAELLTPEHKTPERPPECFKTTNFTSFIRQLNLYGFRKFLVVSGNSDKQSEGESVTDSILHHYHNPNFRQGRPDLLVNLKRLTSTNKAKIEAGLEVNCRPPNRYHRFLLNSPEENTTVEKKVFAGQHHRRRVNSTPYPHQSSSSRQLKKYNGTPVPSRAWISDTSSSTFYTDKGIPSSVIHRFPADSPCGVQSNPPAMNMHQGSQGAINVGQKYDTFLHHHPQYRTGFYTPVSQCCTPGSFDLDMACSHQPAALYSSYGYYPNYTVGYIHPSGQDPDWTSCNSTDYKKNDVNLDMVFKIVDELQVSPTVTRYAVKMASPEKHSAPSRAESHAAGPSSACSSKSASTSTSAQHGLHQTSKLTPVEPSPMNPSFTSLPMGGIIITVPGNASSGIAINMGAPSSQPEVSAKGSQSQSQAAKAAPLEFSQKATANLHKKGTKERFSDSSSSAFSVW